MSMLEPGEELDHIAEFADSGVRTFETPMAEVATPRNTILGHTVGVAAGAASLALFGILSAPSVYVSGVTLARVGAIIVASGLLAKPRQMLDILIGVLLLTIAGWVLNRLMGVPASRWAAPR